MPAPGPGFWRSRRCDSGPEGSSAFDFDATAIRVAKANAHLNRADGLKLFRADVLKYRPEGSFDVVAANLYGDLFRKAASRLWPAIKPRGRLIIFGSDARSGRAGQRENPRTPRPNRNKTNPRKMGNNAGTKDAEVGTRAEALQPLSELSNSLVEKTEWHM